MTAIASGVPAFYSTCLLIIREMAQELNRPIRRWQIGRLLPDAPDAMVDAALLKLEADSLIKSFQTMRRDGKPGAVWYAPYPLMPKSERESIAIIPTLRRHRS